MSSKNEDGTVVSVSSKGQATIPKEIRDQLGIDAPGKVRFRRTDGGVVVEPVERPGEFRGFAADETDASARELLAEGREADEQRDRRLRELAGEEE